MVFLAYVLPSQSDLILYHKKANDRFIVSIAVCHLYEMYLAVGFDGRLRLFRVERSSYPQ